MDVGNKIKKLMNEGKKKTQAIAIALEMDKAVNKKKKKKASQKIAALGVRG
jgi:uncharacterized protein YoaH (UPF0181 family)